MYAHKISGDIMSREDAIDMIQQAQENEFDEVYGMSIDDALKYAFDEV